MEEVFFAGCLNRKITNEKIIMPKDAIRQIATESIRGEVELRELNPVKVEIG